MLGAWSSQPTIFRHGPLYLATPETILQTIRSDALDAQHLLVVGHNPGMQILASQCADQSLEFPTAAAAVFRFAGNDWSTLTPGTLDLIGFNKPKALDLP
jgi:phosphohistidine phosphatase